MIRHLPGEWRARRNRAATGVARVAHLWRPRATSYSPLGSALDKPLCGARIDRGDTIKLAQPMDSARAHTECLVAALGSGGL